MLLCKILIVASTLVLGQAVLISSSRHQKNPYEVKAATQLNTIAIPKPYVAPSVFAKPIVAAPSSAAFVHQHLVQESDYDENPSYNFSYEVNDATSGDIKSQEENLEDGITRGVYSIQEADGTVRRVTYTADDDNGFQATVEKLGTPLSVRNSVPVIPVVKSVPPYQATPVYHNKLISSVLH